MTGNFVTPDERRDNLFHSLNTEFIMWMAENITLIPDRFKKDVKELVESAIGNYQPNTVWYVNRAYEEYCDYGRLEVDSNALVSKGAGYGAYVMAWVFVYNEDMPDELRAPDEVRETEEQGDYEDHE